VRQVVIRQLFIPMYVYITAN